MLDPLCSDPAAVAVFDAFEGVAPVYLVGGSVRDALLGALDTDSADFDFTTPASTDVIQRLLEPLGTVYNIGERFGTIAVAAPCERRGTVKIEVTRHRRDAYDPDSRKPAVSFSEHIEDDLRRRDLTINAIAIRRNGDRFEIIDPFNGAGDIEDGVLRCPDAAKTTMREDPLRQLRAVRFAAKFSMSLSDEVAEAIAEESHRLRIVSAERRADELRKVLALPIGETCQALTLFVALGVDDHAFPELDLAEAVKVMSRLGTQATVSDRFAALAITAKDAKTAFNHLKLAHDEARPALAARDVAVVLDTIGAPAEARRLIRRFGDRAVDTAIACSAVGTSHVVAVARRDEPDMSTRPLPVDGRDVANLGFSGAQIGEALRTIEAAFCDDPDLGFERALALITPHAGTGNNI
jgi:tRNA nucleotidyltransferase/poly(A) polymerase